MLSSAFLVKVRDLAGLCRADFASVRDADASEKNPSSSRSVFSDGVRGLLRGHFTLRIFVCGPGVALPRYSRGIGLAGGVICLLRGVSFRTFSLVCYKFYYTVAAVYVATS